MNVVFTLSMPGVGSWNGRWSGEGSLYAVVERFSTVKARAKATEILAARSYHYRWEDGWAAMIDVREVDNTEARRIRKASKGFCGYQWMIESILARGKILANHEIEEEKTITKNL